MSSFKNKVGAGLAELITNQQKAAKKRIPFRLSVAMKQKLLAAVVEQGYGLKGKSKFVQDAIIELFKNPMWISMVLDSETYATTQATEMEDVYLDTSLVNDIELTGLQLRSAGLKENPPVIFKGIAAPIIRAAILQKITKM